MCDVYELYNAKPNAIHSNNKGYCVLLSNLPTMKQKVFSVIYVFMVYICGIFLLSMVYTVRPTLLYWWHIITGCPHWENIASSLRATDIQYLGLYTIHKIALGSLFCIIVHWQSSVTALQVSYYPGFSEYWEMCWNNVLW